jgi:Glyoxalase/Bleomycin resistance protein/Dioxygenase superfamily
VVFLLAQGGVEARAFTRIFRSFKVVHFFMQGVIIMSHKGFSHVGLSTLDLDGTREFYEKVLGFKVVVADTIKSKEEGDHPPHLPRYRPRSVALAFMAPRGIPGVPVSEFSAIAQSGR